LKTLTLRITDELYQESNAALEQIGLDVPTAFRIFRKGNRVKHKQLIIVAGR